MSIMCGKCKRHHPTKEDVKRCHGLPVEPSTRLSEVNNKASQKPRKTKKKPKPKGGGGRPGLSNSMGHGADRFTPTARGRPEMPMRREECLSCGRVIQPNGHCGCA